MDLIQVIRVKIIVTFIKNIRNRIQKSYFMNILKISSIVIFLAVISISCDKTYVYEGTVINKSSKIITIFYPVSYKTDSVKLLPDSSTVFTDEFNGTGKNAPCKSVVFNSIVADSGLSVSSNFYNNENNWINEVSGTESKKCTLEITDDELK